MISSAWRTAPAGTELDAVLGLVDAVAAADGVAAFSEPVLLDLRGVSPSSASRHLLVSDDDVLVAYAHLDERDPADRVVEMAVAPRHRGRGVGTSLTDLLVAELGTGPVRAWAHGDHPAAAHLAARAGLSRDRELWMMRRPATAEPLPELRVPDGVDIRPLRVGVDEPAVVRVNARAFAWHPEQGAMTVDEVHAREREDWFDADGFLLGWDTATEALLGFHWTKVHARSASVPEPLGEVYVVGVDPDAQGRGLGGALTLAGLHHLARRGLHEVILYVEGDNAPAVATYRRLGFDRTAVDVSWQR